MVIANVTYQGKNASARTGPESEASTVRFAPDSRTLERTVDAVKTMGHDVVIVQTVPGFTLPPDGGGHYPPLCTNVQVLSAECSGRISEARAEDHREASRAIVASVADSAEVDVIDTWPFFCQDGWCESDDGNVVLYKDRGHITVPASEMLVPRFVEGPSDGNTA